MKIVDISGTGHCGKTLLSEILATNHQFHVHNPSFEFNLIRVYGGIADLDYHLQSNWSPNRCDIALKNFNHLIKTISNKANILKPKSLLNSNGWNYNMILNNDFEKLSVAYINNLIDLDIQLYWNYPHIYENSFKRLYRKILIKFFNHYKKDNFLLSEGKNFEKLTKQYLQKVLSIDKNKIVCTNNMFEPFDPEKYFKFFENPRSIIVWRDPRDIYCSTQGKTQYIPDFEKKLGSIKKQKQFLANNDLKNFIKRQEILFNKCKFSQSKKILNIKFEDIALDFYNSMKIVEEFLDIDLGDKNHISNLVKIEKSKKNIGLWKEYKNQSEIQLIESSLDDYMKTFGYKNG